MNKMKPTEPFHTIIVFIFGIIGGLAIGAMFHVEPSSADISDMLDVMYADYIEDLREQRQFDRTVAVVRGLRTELWTDDLPETVDGWVDGWGNPLYYKRTDDDPMRTYLIGSMGPDGAWNTEHDLWWDNHGRVYALGR